MVERFTEPARQAVVLAELGTSPEELHLDVIEAFSGPERI